MTKAPDTFPRLTPYFTVKNADEFMEFAREVFGATILKESRYEDGTIQHARLLIGDSMLMLNQATDEYVTNSSQMHLYVDDVEETYRLAINNGSKSLIEPMLRPHGDRMAGFCDPENNTWWIAAR